MKPDELRSKLGGVISFPVTTFHPDHSLDLDGLRKNLRELIQHPVCAIVPAAGTGELFSLTPDEHQQVVQA
ncbi:MAG TPA: 5-dehydro-4-deoxyglucarate dehydratase, partial [Verrucomicrobiales bacterium]|nr:5-dehydro-4-deoxyglucarate dehydratase [Verrucomicrobiales bacterium]